VKYLVISDIHANLHAFDAVLAEAARLGHDRTLVLGDLVGYGGDPGPVIDRTLALNATALIRGNHDKVCAGLDSPASFNDIARVSIEWTARQLSASQLAALAALPAGPLAVDETVEICHGAPFDEDFYVFSDDDAARALDASSRRLCLFGHTHVPCVFAMEEQGRAGESAGPDEILLPRSGRVLINVGSVGQPRDGDPRAAFGILDLERNSVFLHRVAYDIEGAQKRILDAGLPDWLAYRLERGQ
jgi:diadenosine tetraphosphatase ApaH/serine/threonine PP2A family protein phosphatase